MYISAKRSFAILGGAAGAMMEQRVEAARAASKTPGTCRPGAPTAETGMPA